MTNNSSEMRNEARKLRKLGKSYREIAYGLNIPLSTTHLWTKHIELTKEQQQFIKLKHEEAFRKGRIKAQFINNERAAVIKKNLINEGQNIIGLISKRELTLIGAALYWAEGFKKDSRLGFANSDPFMIKLLLRWLYEIGNVPKKDIRLRVGINIHHQYRTEEIQTRWSVITQIPLSQFQKPFYQKSKQVKQYSNHENYLGVLRIRANNQSELFQKILGMIEGFKSNSK